MAVVRFATLDDVSSLAHLTSTVQQLHATALPHIFKAPDLGAIAADFRVRILGNPQSRVLVVDMDGELAACAVVQFMERPENTFTYALRWLHIDQIGVKPSHQRRGLGHMLLESAAALARSEGITRVTLDTWAFNRQAQAFFKKNDFEIFNYRLEKFLA
jgi:ribosomal protein S18 acetylase RimI-like enzyme